MRIYINATPLPLFCISVPSQVPILHQSCLARRSKTSKLMSCRKGDDEPNYPHFVYYVRLLIWACTPMTSDTKQACCLSLHIYLSWVMGSLSCSCAEHIMTCIMCCWLQCICSVFYHCWKWWLSTATNQHARQPFFVTCNYVPMEQMLPVSCDRCINV